MMNYASASLLLVLFLAGCASSDPYAINAGDVARSYLPNERDVPHAPDSLANLSIVEKEGRLVFKTERSFKEMLRAWSATWRSVDGSARTGSLDYRTYATLWSLEASLMSLQPERGIQGLSKDLARQTIAERRGEFQDQIQIDVYRFAGSPPSRSGLSSLRLGGPGDRVLLEDGEGRTYKPVRIESGIPVETFVSTRSALYARNSLFFKRFVEGRDLLEAERLRLEIRQSQLLGINRYYFVWTFPTAPEAGMASSPR